MDALAAYASDSDEEAGEVEASTNSGRVLLTPAPALPRAEVNASPRKGIFDSLPPPRSEPSGQKASSLFTSLPPPKGEELDASLPETSNEKVLFKGLPAPQASSGAGERSNLLAGLPPPKVAKKVVEFKLPLNTSQLSKGRPEPEDDDWQPPKRRKAAVEEGGTPDEGPKKKGLSLASFLPAPKNTLGMGTALGGGIGQGGKRTILETSTAAEPSSNAASQGGATATANLHYSSATSVAPQPDRVPGQQGYSSAATDELGTAQWQGVGGMGYPEDYRWQGGASVQHQPGVPAYEEGSMSADSLLQQKLREEQERKGRNAKHKGFPAAAQIVEVKQADLRKKNVTEDTMRATGKAFGPGHQPVSSLKAVQEKFGVQKIHKRKHQLNALYLDMKSKEMELLERRAQGFMSKAQTQGKYGW